MIKYSIDTRTLQPGEHYVAIRGERYDGHTFIPDALRKGAAGLVVDHRPETVPANIALTVVDDTERHLAEQARDRLLGWNTDVIAVTGSVGKTTTKAALTTVLGEAFPIVAPKGNLNTVLGLALTILNELTDPGQKLVAEMGAYQRGSIARLCRYFRPTIAVVTTVQPVHLERMGTIENIQLAKQELVEALPESGIACLNYDDLRVRAMADACQGQVVFYGTDSLADIRPDRLTVDVPLLGSYAIHTALSVFAAGLGLGMSEAALNTGITKLKPERGRLHWLSGRNGSTLIDDTYNAALASTAAALDVLKTQPAQRRIAFLGDMLELGTEEEHAHQAVVTHAAEVADLVVLVGERMATAFEAVNQTLQATHIRLFETSKDVVAALEAGDVYIPKPGDVAVAKGSAGTRMERIMAALLHEDLDPRDVLVRHSPGWLEI